MPVRKRKVRWVDRTVSKGFTVKVGDYEFVRIDVGGTVRIEEGDDPTKTLKAAINQMDDELVAELQDVHENLGISRKSAFTKLLET